MNWKYVLFIALCVGSGVTLGQYLFSEVSAIKLAVNYSVPVIALYIMLAICNIGKKNES